MTSFIPATVLVVEDDPSQRESMQILLGEFGSVAAFGHPKDALEYLRTHTVDVAVVDIRMPGLEVDGIWFMQEVRKDDTLLGIVLRTGDSDISIAQAGIEARAVQRVIKGDRNSVVQLKAAVRTAIMETRERRALSASGEEANEAKAKLFQAIGQTDGDLTLANLCLGFAHDLSPKLTALGGFSARLLALSADNPDKQIKELAVKLEATSESLRKKFSEFMANPFLGDKGVGRTPTCNGCCAALSSSFKADPLYAGLNLLIISGQHSDQPIGANPVKALSILRHIVGYCRAHLEPGSQISVVWSQVHSAIEHLKHAKNELPLNPVVAPGTNCAMFTVSAKIGEPSLGELEAATRATPIDVKTGSLFVAANIADEERLLFTLAKNGRSADFRIFLPLR
jgi:CheY-like chemotaxis protein